MKKLLAVVLAALSLSALAKENVTIYYSWSAADVAANFHRQLANESNKLQDKYNFIFDVKPGAGGSIAANYILNNAEQTGILANSSAFFIRPNFFPNESHDLTKFKELFPQCSAPIAISSKKYKTWAEVPKNAQLTIGVSGLGVTTHLVATEVAKKYPNMTVVPFKSTAEALLATLGGQTDFAVNFIGDSAQYKEGKNRVYVLGITGKHAVGDVKTFTAQGFSKDLELMNTPAQLFVSTKLSDTKFKEWREIFLLAGKTKEVQDAYKVDFCQSNNQMTDAEAAKYYQDQLVFWKRISQGISLK